MSRLDQRTWADVEEIAQGMEVTPFQSTSYGLFIDLDNGATVNTNVWEMLVDRDFLVKDCALVTTSKSCNGNHLYLRLNSPLDVPARAALQAALGSNSKREALAIIKLQLGSKEDAVIVLFEAPEEVERVKEWMEDVQVQLATTRLRGKSV